MHPRVVHCLRSPYDVYIGRGTGPKGEPGIWGNPFSWLPGTPVKYKVRNRNEAIARYAEWIQEQDYLLKKLPELKGKVLGCFCKPLACHGEVLAEIVDLLVASGDLV